MSPEKDKQAAPAWTVSALTVPVLPYKFKTMSWELTVVMVVRTIKAWRRNLRLQLHHVLGDRLLASM